MKYNYKDIQFRELTEEEKSSYKEDGFIGDGCGDGYPQSLVTTYSKVYSLPYKNTDYCETFSIDFEQIVIGGLYDSGCGNPKVVVDVNGETSADVFYIIKPTICSMGCTSNYKVFDDFGEAVDYYEKLCNFGMSLKEYKSKI